MNWDMKIFLTSGASKNLVGPGHPIPSARHCHLLIIKPQCLDQSSSGLFPIPYCLFDKLFNVDSSLNSSSDSGHPCLTPLPTLGLVLASEHSPSIFKERSIIFWESNRPKHECVLFIYYFNLCRQSDLASCIHNKGLYSTFPNVSIALRLFMCLMVSNCSGERSFS